MNMLAWVIAVIGLVAAGYFGAKAERAETRAEQAEAKLESAERLESVPNDAQAVRFVRADEHTITFGVPRQVEVNGQSFVDYVERTATYGPALVVSGVEADGYAALSQIQAGTTVYVRTIGNIDDNLGDVEAIYIFP